MEKREGGGGGGGGGTYDQRLQSPCRFFNLCLQPWKQSFGFFDSLDLYVYIGKESIEHPSMGTGAGKESVCSMMLAVMMPLLPIHPWMDA